MASITHPHWHLPHLLKGETYLDTMKSVDSLLGVLLLVLATLNVRFGIVGPTIFTIAGTIALWAAFSKKEKVVATNTTIVGFILAFCFLFYVREAT